MQIKITKIIFAIGAAALISACNDQDGFYQSSVVNARYRSDQQLPPTGFYTGKPPAEGRRASAPPPSFYKSDAQTSESAGYGSDVQGSAPPAEVTSAAPPSTTAAVPPSAVGGAAPPSTTAQ